jgi:hypothetical protein
MGSNFEMPFCRLGTTTDRWANDTCCQAHPPNKPARPPPRTKQEQQQQQHFFGPMVITRSKCPHSVMSRTPRQSIKTPVRNGTGGRDPRRLGRVGGRSWKGKGRGLSLTKKNDPTTTRNEEAETVQVEAAVVETVQVEAAVLPLLEEDNPRTPCGRNAIHAG